MVNGSLDFKDGKFYKHNSLFFLTSSSFEGGQSKLTLMCLEMPTYENVSQACPGPEVALKGNEAFKIH